MNTMEVTPNWRKHSKKEAKRKLKPQALRQSRARLQALKRKLGIITNANENRSQLYDVVMPN